MDPSIMKLLEEDEDESMHCGADVEAFTAALNRDIEGPPPPTASASASGSGSAAAASSSSQPLQSLQSDSTILSQENNQASGNMYSQWESSNQDENNGNQSQQQDMRSQEQREQQTSDMEVKEHGSRADVKQEVKDSQTPGGGVQMQYKPMQIDNQGQQLGRNSVEFSRSSAASQTQMSGNGQSQIQETHRMLNSGGESQFSNANVQRFSGQATPGPGPEHVGNQANRAKQIPFGSLLPIILPELDKDRAMQLQTLYAKLRKNEIPKEGFVRHMRSIVGDQMLRLAVVKMQAKGNKNPEAGPGQLQMQSQNPMQQQILRPQTGTPTQFSDPYSFGQLHQKSQSSPAASATSRTPTSMMQMQKDSSHNAEHVVDSRGMHANQIPDRSAISIQGLSKQQQQHIHFSPSSFPMYGSGSYHPYAGTNVNTTSPMVRPQLVDSQMRQGQVHQGFGSTHGDGMSHAMNAMNIPKVERPNSHSEPQRVLGATMSNLSTAPSIPHNSISWQPMLGKDQKVSSSPSTVYVKQESGDQPQENQLKPPVYPSQGPSPFGALHNDHGKTVPGTSVDNAADRQHPGVAFPQSTRAATLAPCSSVPSHVAPSSDADLQSASAGSMYGTASNPKASAKKPTSGQKKPLDTHSSLPTVPSKKQKVAGGFSDQSIEHLNDVTAVSGVNLREEEEQLFSGAKDDGRISEASRKAVQEEEERLILQKAPLQNKLAEIMTKCGLKNLSNDVERCLSLCVEERLRGLLSALIRVSKQRVDSDKSQHKTVVTSDVREQILAINRKAREEWEKKQAETGKIDKVIETDSDTGVDGEKEKEEGRGKAMKVNKEDDDKMRTTAANVAARAAVGGDDMLSKWQLMAQAARQKREGGPEAASTLHAAKDKSSKPSTSSAGNVMDNRGSGKRDLSPAPTSGVMRQEGRSDVIVSPPRVARVISVKDVIAVLEREPQMAKSTIIYRLYDNMHTDAAVE